MGYQGYHHAPPEAHENYENKTHLHSGGRACGKQANTIPHIIITYILRNIQIISGRVTFVKIIVAFQFLFC